MHHRPHRSRQLLPLLLIPLLCLSMLAAVPRAAEGEAANASDPVSDPFEPMAFVIGHCWDGTLGGGSLAESHCFEWVHEGQLLGHRHTARGDEPVYDGTTHFAWNPEEGRLVFLHASEQGIFSSGSVEVVDGVVAFPQRMVTPGGVRELKAVWSRPAENRYTVTVHERIEGDWQELFAVDYTRRDG